MINEQDEVCDWCAKQHKIFGWGNHLSPFLVKSLFPHQKVHKQPKHDVCRCRLKMNGNQHEQVSANEE